MNGFLEVGERLVCLQTLPGFSGLTERPHILEILLQIVLVLLFTDRETESGVTVDD